MAQAVQNAVHGGKIVIDIRSACNHITDLLQVPEIRYKSELSSDLESSGFN
jgi:hypothetical protein